MLVDHPGKPLGAGRKRLHRFALPAVEAAPVGAQPQAVAVLSERGDGVVREPLPRGVIGEDAVVQTAQPAEVPIQRSPFCRSPRSRTPMKSLPSPSMAEKLLNLSPTK